MQTAVLKVGGMTCGGCVRSVTRVLQSLNGVKQVEVSLELGEAKVVFDPRSTTLDQIRGAVADAGYTAN